MGIKSVNRDKCLITGISGQDGSYLAELLLQEGYEVFGIIRRHSVASNQDSRLKNIKNITTYYGDLLDPLSIAAALQDCQPDIIFNLAAQSHVGISSKMPSFTTQVNTIGFLNILEMTRKIVPLARVYQASSSEMFGNSITHGKQNELTPMHPVSPYGCSKLFSYHLAKHYRQAYNMFVSNGILFNHESPRRGENFVTQKIVKAAKSIKEGKQDKLVLGNVKSMRDWGHSKDYVRAMLMIMQHSEADDFVVSSNETHTIESFARLVFEKLDLDYNQYVITNAEEYKRPQELNYLCGDSTKIRTVLGWKPEYNFDMLVDDMLRN